jgi:hypothetical protein
MIVNKKVLRELLDKVAGDGDCFFYALATEEMKNYIINGDDPAVNRMPKNFRNTLLSGRGIALENGLLVKFAAGEADADTTHVLNMCHIMLNAPINIQA